MLKIFRSFSITSICIILFCGAVPRSENPQKALTLKILTYNIHHASPPSQPPDSIDLDAIADVISAQKPDLVALQEVDVFTGRSGPYNQAEVLANKTGMTAHFYKAIDYDGGEYGVAILSRYPMGNFKRYPLPTKEGSGGEPRVLGTATIELPGNRKILFACTHLDALRDSVNRELQINAISEALKDSAIPVIVAGDFNASPGTKVIRLLDSYFKRTCSPCEFTSPETNPRKAIDFIAFAPVNYFLLKEHKVIPERYASDHLPVMAIIEVKK